MIRLQGRRRLGSFGRRILQLLLIAGVLTAAGYFAADYVPREQIDHHWQELKAKLLLTAE